MSIREKRHHEGLIKNYLQENLEAITRLILGTRVEVLRHLDKELFKFDAKKIPDYLSLIKMNDEEMILHVEHQSTNDPSMTSRMIEYLGRIMQIRGLPRKILQLIIYTGNDALKMLGSLEIETSIKGSTFRIEYRVPIVDLKTIDENEFFKIDIPEIAVLAVLGKTSSIEKTIRKIINYLKARIKDKEKLKNLIARLDVACQIRNMEDVFLEEVKKLSDEISIERSALYRLGKEEGIKEGIKEGMKEGMKEGLKEGMKEGLIQAILLDLKIKFDIDENAEAEIKNALEKIDDLKRLQELKKAALVASTLDEFINQL